MPPSQLLPLFPLGLVMLPHQPVPLHIFEERYKTMIGECLSQDAVFGIVYFNGKRIAETGCTARVVEVLNRYEDGRMDILVLGEKRFLIRGIDESRSYLQASIEYFDDVSEEPDSAWRRWAEQGLELLRSYSQMTPPTEGFRLADGLDYKGISFLIAGNEGFSPDEKQAFLEMTSTRMRLKKSVTALGHLVKRLRISEEIQRIISGNGHMRKLPGQPDG
jgi:Lon protease-like protein